MMPKMPNTNQENLSIDESWDDCSPGEIQGMVKSLKRSRRNRELTQVASVGVAFVLLFAITLWSFPQQPGAKGLQAGKLACVDVLERAEDYVAGRLDALVNGRIEEHLAHCASCTQKIDSLRAQVESEIVVPPVLQTIDSSPLSISNKVDPKRFDWNLALASN